MKGSWWRCFGYVVLMWVGMLLLLIATAMVTGGFVDPLAALHVSQAAIPGGVSVAAHTSVSIVAFIVQLLVPLLMVSLWAVLVYLLFTDLQIRKGPGGTSRRPRPATGRTGPEGVPGPGHGEGAGSIASGAAGGPPPFGGPPSPGPQPMGGSPLPAFGSGPSNRGYGPAPGAPQGPPPAR